MRSRKLADKARNKIDGSNPGIREYQFLKLYGIREFEIGYESLEMTTEGTINVIDLICKGMV